MHRPVSRMGRRPKRSDSGPQTICEQPNASNRPLSVSCAAAIGAARLLVMAGRAGRYRSVVTGCMLRRRASTRMAKPGCRQMGAAADVALAQGAGISARAYQKARRALSAAGSAPAGHGGFRNASVASPIICRSALAIEAQRGVASLANTARYGLRDAPCAALRWLRAAYDI